MSDDKNVYARDRAERFDAAIDRWRALRCVRPESDEPVAVPIDYYIDMQVGPLASLCAETKQLVSLERLAARYRAGCPDIEDVVSEDFGMQSSSECPLPVEVGAQCEFYYSAQVCLVRRVEMSQAACPMANPVVLPICFVRLPR